MKLKIPDLTQTLNRLTAGLPKLERRIPELRAAWKEKGGAGGLVGQSLRDAWIARLGNELRRKGCGRMLVLAGGSGREAAALALRVPNAGVTAAAVNPDAAAQAMKEKLSRGAQNLAVEGLCAERLECADDYFDCAVTAFSLGEAGDAAAVLAELRRVVRPGGMVYCLEETSGNAPASDSLKSLAAAPFRRGGGGKLYTRAQLCRLMADAGLTEVASYGHIMDAAACCRGIK